MKNIVRVHGNVDGERIKAATSQFLKKVQQEKKARSK